MSNSVHGFARPEFEGVRAVFAEHLVSQADLGASFCATIDGETVVDLWGGWADEAKTRPWIRDTIVNVYSTTKTMTALCALLLADRGELDFETPVARYWPEFAANGKQAVTVGQLMAHSSGLSGWQEPIGRGDLYDWEKVTTLLAAQAPFWEPGSAPGYHGFTQGYLVGEVVRRITGRSLGTFFREEFSQPLGADFHIGLVASEDERVADLIPPPPGPPVSRTPLQANMLENPGIDVADTRTRAWRGAEIPAAGGTGNARSIARIQSILSNGGMADGRRFLSEATCRSILVTQVEGHDLIRDVPARFGLGYGLAGSMVPLPSEHSFYWGGYGGSIVVNDLHARATYAFAMNKMTPTTTGDPRAFALIGRMRERRS